MMLEIEITIMDEGESLGTEEPQGKEPSRLERIRKRRRAGEGAGTRGLEIEETDLEKSGRTRECMIIEGTRLKVLKIQEYN